MNGILKAEGSTKFVLSIAQDGMKLFLYAC